MDYSIELYQRPNAEPSNGRIVDSIINITERLTGTWFTANVPDDTLRDLKFHDVLCVEKQQQVLSFIIFTSWDGMIYITLMATRLDMQGRGFGTHLLQYFFIHAQKLGFEKCAVMTVPDDVNPLYEAAIRFYQKHGFMVAKRYNEFWEHGAIQLLKKL